MKRPAGKYTTVEVLGTMKAGAKCPHGVYWYAETESENTAFPVGSLNTDCQDPSCREAVERYGASFAPHAAEASDG